MFTILEQEYHTKGQILCDPTYMRYLAQSNSQRQRIEWQLPEAWGEGAGSDEELVFDGERVSIGEDEKVLELDDGDGDPKI